VLLDGEFGDGGGGGGGGRGGGMINRLLFVFLHFHII